MTRTIIIFLFIAILLCQCKTGMDQRVKVSGELKKWHRVTLTFEGPQSGESDTINPFLDYRLDVTFKQAEKKHVVPGFYATDGNAGETGSTSGNKWRVYFCPDAEGTWSYSASFRKGNAIAVSDDPGAGGPVSFDGLSGTFQIAATDKTGSDFRGKGKLCYVGGHHLQFAETQDYFLKGGADSPENFLAYEDFDGTMSGPGLGPRPGDNIKLMKLHAYAPHASDWQEGDPLWQGNKGKNIIGALNYLASKGMNSVYMLTMNVQGDGDDVWPWTGHDERYRFDCSKLDQWEIVFSHMDKLGLMLHFVTQETENECLLDSGDTGVQRKLYYRELVARFAHHLAITWNLGEENGPAGFSPIGQTDKQRKDAAAYLKKINPYKDFVVVHTHSGQAARDNILIPLLGYPGIDGPSIQVGNMKDSHEQTIKWLTKSAETGKNWVVCVDEIGPANTGVKPDSADPAHDDVRKYVLWANLVAGGGGVEWYFGYNYPHNDLNCEDWRSRDKMWDQTRVALEFFHQYLPFWETEASDSLISSGKAFCLARVGEVYTIYLPDGGSAKLDLQNQAGSYSVQWFNPRTGRELVNGKITQITGGQINDIGLPPGEIDEDWVVVIKKLDNL